MPGLPRRPRQHEIESESRTAFRRIMEGQGWVVRPVDNPDYGLDDLVEVFVNGEATGLLFYVQVRGTDEEDLRRALAVRVRREQQAYFAAVGHPVLIVRYQATSGRIFARWFHRFDPHPRHGTETLRLSESDELAGDRVGALTAEVQLFRVLSSAAVPWPIGVQVSSTTPHSDRDMALAMSAVVGQEQPYADFCASRDATDSFGLTIELQPDRVVVHGGLASVTLHGDINSLDLDDVAADAVVAVGVVLGMMDHIDAAAALIAVSAAGAPSFRDELLIQAASVLARGRRIGDALTAGRALAGLGRRTEARLLVAPAAMASSNLMSEDELRAVERFNRELADAAESAGDSQEAAATHYSLGNWLFSAVGDWEGALASFERAQVLDPSYADRDYFLRELAAALFECERYEESATTYERVIDRGDGNQKTLACFGDALLMAGRYEDALATFERYLSDPLDSEPVWVLKAAVARQLVHRGFAEQDRDEQGAYALVAQAQSFAGDKRLAECDKALALDGLCPSAWHLMALTLAETNAAEAAVPLLISALAARNPDLWALAVTLLLEAGERSLAEAAAAHALREAGPAFSRALQRSGALFSAHVLEPALALVEELERTITRPDQGFTLRLPGEDGEVVEFEVSPPGD